MCFFAPKDHFIPKRKLKSLLELHIVVSDNQLIKKNDFIF
jgi:hypothetical protein